MMDAVERSRRDRHDSTDSLSDYGSDGASPVAAAAAAAAAPPDAGLVKRPSVQHGRGPVSPSLISPKNTSYHFTASTASPPAGGGAGGGAGSSSVTTPPLRPQRSFRSLANGTRSPPSANTPGTGRSPRIDLADLPATEDAVVAAAAAAPNGLGISSSTTEDTDAALVAQAEAEALAEAEAEAEARPRTLSGVRALAKERARLRKEAALAAVNASTGITPSDSSTSAADSTAATDDHNSALYPVADDALRDGTRARRRQASRQDTALRDTLQASIEAGIAPDSVSGRTHAAIPEDRIEGRHRSHSHHRRSVDSTDRASVSARRSTYASPPLPSTATAHDARKFSQSRQSIASVEAQAAGARLADEFAQLDAALTAALDDLSFDTSGNSSGTLRNSDVTPTKQALREAIASQSPLLGPKALASASRGATLASAPAAADAQPLVFPDQGSAGPSTITPPTAHPHSHDGAAMPSLPIAAALASRERPPKATGPVPHNAFIPTPAPATSHAAPAASSTQQPKSSLISQRRNTLPPPTDSTGQLLVYGKSIPFPEPFLNTSVPGMSTSASVQGERKRHLLGNAALSGLAALHPAAGGGSGAGSSGLVGNSHQLIAAMTGSGASSSQSSMSISAPSSGLIHPTVERSKAYAAKTNALFAIETGLDVWVRAMDASRPGARKAYLASLNAAATASASSSSGMGGPSFGGGRTADSYGGASGPGSSYSQLAGRRASAHAGLALGGMSAGGPVSAAAAAYKQSLAGLQHGLGGAARQLAVGPGGRSHSVAAGMGGAGVGMSPSLPSSTFASHSANNASESMGQSYAQFGSVGAQHPNRREEPSVATMRSDMTFPMRGDGGRAKDITPANLGHGSHMASSDSTDSARSGGFVGGGGDKMGSLPPQPESPPNAPPKNLPYPGVLYQGKTNSTLSVNTVSSTVGNVGARTAHGSAGASGLGKGDGPIGMAGIPPRSSSIDLPPDQLRGLLGEAAFVPMPPLPASTTTQAGSAAMRPTQSTSSFKSGGGYTDPNVQPPSRRTSLHHGRHPSDASGSSGPVDLSLGPAPAFEPAPSHGPRMPRTATLTSSAGSASRGSVGNISSNNMKGTSSGTSSPRMPPSSGATTPREHSVQAHSQGYAPGHASAHGNGPGQGQGQGRAAATPVMTRLRLDSLEHSTPGQGQSWADLSGGGGGKGGGGVPDLATPGSGTTYMSALSQPSGSNTGPGNDSASFIAAQTGLALSASSPMGANHANGHAASGRYAKVLGPRAPKLSLSEMPAFDSAGLMNGTAVGGGGSAVGTSGPASISYEVGKRPSLSSSVVGGSGGGGGAGHGRAGGSIYTPSSPRDPKDKYAASERSPSPSPSVGTTLSVHSLASKLPGASYAPPPPPLPGQGGAWSNKNSPVTSSFPSSSSPTATRRPSAATGFIPVGVSSTVRKSSFGGAKREVSHSRDFFYSDLGRKEGQLGDEQGFGEEPIVVSPKSTSASSSSAGGMIHGSAGGGGGGGAGHGGTMLSPPGTPGLFGTSLGSSSQRSRTLSRSGSSFDVRSMVAGIGGGGGGGGGSSPGAAGQGNSIDGYGYGRPGGTLPGLPRSPSLFDTSTSATIGNGGGGGGTSSASVTGISPPSAFRANSSGSLLSYGSVRHNSATSVSGAASAVSSSSSPSLSTKEAAAAAKKLQKKLQFEETLAKMQDVIPDGDREVLAKYLEKANGNDLAAMHHYFVDQAKGKVAKTSRAPRRGNY